MAWSRKGVIVAPDADSAWMHSHATLPSPLVMDDRIRVFFATRDPDNRSRIGYVDLDRADPTRRIGLSAEPVLDLGPLGRFDDNGVAPSCLVRDGDDVLMYFVGITPRVTVPLAYTIGLAVSHDGGHSFSRVFDGPIVDCNETEPYLFTSPWVLKHGDDWHMWYTCGTGWTVQDGRPNPLYHIKYAHSRDGRAWRRDDVSCVPPRDPLECTARPAVVRDGARWRMWTCWRGSTDFRDGSDAYRLGYAEGTDPVTWTRDDAKAGLDLAEGGGFDDLMVAYPATFDAEGRRWLVYNGNGFGKSGAGLALWEGG